MAKPVVVSIKDSITAKLLKVVFGFYLLIALSVTLVHMMAEYYNTKDGVYQDMVLFQKTFTGALSLALWNVNFEALKFTLDGMLEVPIIVGIHITEETEKETMARGIVRDEFGVPIFIDENGNRQPVPEDNPFSELLEYRFPIYHDDAGETFVVGEGIIYSSTSKVFEKVQYGFLFIIINSIIKTVALWVIFLWVGRRLLTQPLSILVAFTKRLRLEDLKNAKVDIQTKGFSELKVLEAAFNDMTQKLHQNANELEKAYAEISHLNQMMLAVNATLDLDEVMSEAIEAIKSVFNFDVTTIQLVDYDKQELVQHKIYGERISDAQKEKFQSVKIDLWGMDSLSSAVIHAKELIHLPEVIADAPVLEADRRIFDIIPYVSALILPLIIQKRVVGCIGFYGMASSFELNKAEIETVKRYVIQIATAINNARLFTHLQETTGRLESQTLALNKALQQAQRREQDIRQLNSLLYEVKSTLHHKEILRSLMSSVLIDRFPFEGIFLHLVDKEHQTLQLETALLPTEVDSSVTDPLYEISIPLAPEGGMFAFVCMVRQSLYITEMLPEIRKSFINRQYQEVLPFMSALLLPLTVQHRIVGVLTLFHRDQRPDLIEEDIQVLQSYVDHITPSINNAQLYEQVQKSQREIQERNDTLSTLSFKLSRYLSPQLVDSILAGTTDARLGSQRKKLSIFFSRLTGFTELTDTLESETLTELLNHYVKEMTRIAIKHGGTIDKITGEMIMVFFGDPMSQGEEPDALACVNMALEMRDSLKLLRRAWEKKGMYKPLHLHIGINSGYCTVGNFGSASYRLNYTIVGGQVNLANKLHAMADEDQILISYETYALLDEQVACEKQEEVVVTGQEYPVQTYNVLDTYERLNQKMQSWKHKSAGAQLSVDFHRLQEAEKLRLVTSIQKAIDRLENDLGQG